MPLLEGTWQAKSGSGRVVGRGAVASMAEDPGLNRRAEQSRRLLDAAGS